MTVKKANTADVARAADQAKTRDADHHARSVRLAALRGHCVGCNTTNTSRRYVKLGGKVFKDLGKGGHGYLCEGCAWQAVTLLDEVTPASARANAERVAELEAELAAERAERERVEEQLDALEKIKEVLS